MTNHRRADDISFTGLTLAIITTYAWFLSQVLPYVH